MSGAISYYSKWGRYHNCKFLENDRRGGFYFKDGEAWSIVGPPIAPNIEQVDGAISPESLSPTTSSDNPAANRQDRYENRKVRKRVQRSEHIKRKGPKIYHPRPVPEFIDESYSDMEGILGDNETEFVFNERSPQHQSLALPADLLLEENRVYSLNSYLDLALPVNNELVPGRVYAWSKSRMLSNSEPVLATEGRRRSPWIKRWRSFKSFLILLNPFKKKT